MNAAPDTGRLDPWGAFVDRAAPPAEGDGPLAGLRLAIKDNIAVAGLKWTAGLPLFADRIATSDAACVANLRAAGARIVGTTTTDAAGFGMMTPGVVNPIAPDRTAGGSSGGSAAAVAAGLALGAARGLLKTWCGTSARRSLAGAAAMAARAPSTSCT